MSNCVFEHQYIDRASGAVVSEQLLGDRTVGFLYHTVREQAPALFRACTGAWMSSLLGHLHFDRPSWPGTTGLKLLRRLGVDPDECLEPPHCYDSYRKVFERQIRYWRYRPITNEPGAVVSPSDARFLPGSAVRDSLLFIKEKFFTISELLGSSRGYQDCFGQGDFAVFRLTPDKYHYNHFPVSGLVRDWYQVDGAFNSCNPSATLAAASVYAKNRRTVTIIDTDCDRGTGVGLVAMIEIVALMIGDLVQCCSEHRYQNPQPLRKEHFYPKGSVKSLFRPGSSTVVLLFEPDRISFSADLIANARRRDVRTRFSRKFQLPVVETDLKVRSTIGYATRRNRPCLNSPL